MLIPPLLWEDLLLGWSLEEGQEHLGRNPFPYYSSGYENGQNWESMRGIVVVLKAGAQHWARSSGCISLPVLPGTTLSPRMGNSCV